MPIKGLTDGNRIPRYVTLGKLFKGSKKPSENQPGKELPYWRFVSKKPEVEKAFLDAYGPSPVTLPVYLPYAKPDENLQTWQEAWSKGGLQHRCDGETMHIWLDGKTYNRTPKPCTGDCAKVGRLTLILPRLVAAGWVGYVLMETHGINDIIHLHGVLADIFGRTNNELGLRGIQFDLYRQEEMVSAPTYIEDADGRIRVKKYNVKIEPSADWVRVRLGMEHAGQLNQPVEVPQLPASTIDIDPDTGEILNVSDDIEQPEEQETADAPAEGEIEEEKLPFESSAEPEKPKEESKQPPPSEHETAPSNMTLVDALNTKTPKGALLGSLKTSQLTTLLRWLNSEERSDKERKTHQPLLEATRVVYDNKMKNGQ
jgi:hypothetical protein